MTTSATPSAPAGGPPASGGEPGGLKRLWARLGTAKGLGVAAAGLLVVWAGVMLLWDLVPNVCRDEVASSDTAKTPAELVVQVCEPMTATDPRVFLFLFVVLLLLLPWFSEVEVAGLFRVKKQVAEAEKEVDGLRESVRTAQAQVANLTSTTFAQQAQNTQVDTKFELQLHDHRREDSAQTAQAVLAGKPEVEVTEGAYAQLAFTAALEGLPSLYSDETAPTAMVFFTYGDAGPVQHGTVGDVDTELEEAALEMVTKQKPKSFAHREPSGYLVLADAADDDGTSVGLVVSAFRQDQWAHHVGVFADVEVVAGAYARLIIDLLGETGRLLPSNDDSERGQSAS